MQRRNFLKSIAVTGSSVSLPRLLFADDDVSPNYSESVALYGINGDGSHEFSLRLSRRPDDRSGMLWASVHSDGSDYSAAIDGLDLAPNNNPTAVENDHVVFRVSGKATAEFERSGLAQTVRALVSATAHAHATPHPPVGLGEHSIQIEAEFNAWHSTVYPRRGRLEMMGTTSGKLITPSGTVTMEGVGAWHEQVGERPSFAPAFTYFKVMGDRFGVLASVRHDTNTSWGYGFLDNQVVPVHTFRIDDQQRVREFEIGLAGGQVVEGKAVRIRQTSVPIEGQRRPGTIVRVTSSIGSMIGILNDWNPD